MSDQLDLKKKIAYQFRGIHIKLRILKDQVVLISKVFNSRLQRYRDFFQRKINNALLYLRLADVPVHAHGIKKIKLCRRRGIRLEMRRVVQVRDEYGLC